MYYTQIENSDSKNFDTLTVDGKIFYFRKTKKTSITKPRRYSDQFKKSECNYQDIYRKLKILRKHEKDNKDLDILIEEWKECITKCINILQQEYCFTAKDIFKIFNLKKYNFCLNEFNENDSEDDILD